VKILSKAQIKYIQSLRQKKFRDEAGVFIAEGPKLVLELLDMAVMTPISIFATASWWHEHPQWAARMAEHAVEIRDFELEKLSALQQPQSVLAVFEQPRWALKDLKWVLVLDGIQDPGNLGTLIRTADWFAFDAVIASASTVDVFNPKVVQASMGSIGRIPVIYQDLLVFLQETKLPVYATVLDGRSLHEQTAIQEAALMIGNEGNGIRPELLKLAPNHITIPRLGATESLNAAVAAGIVMSWFRR
jgi:RNA methyltransferase, TrmH family